MRIDLTLFRAVALARVTDEPRPSYPAMNGVHVVSTPGRVLIAAGNRYRFFFGAMIQAPGTETGSWVLAPETVDALIADPSEFAKLDPAAGIFLSPVNLGHPLSTMIHPFPEWRKIVPDDFYSGKTHQDVLSLDARFIELLIQAHRVLVPEEVSPTVRIRQHKGGEYVAAFSGVPEFGAILAGMKPDGSIVIPKVK
ncbi:hypothetical protein B2_8 [Stenotrophomonas phage B2]|nr:hypothetical protein B2_8 [Stenotrophomonas phage B2]